MLGKYAEWGKQVAENYFSVTRFEPKTSADGRKTYITSENRDKLLKYLSFGVLIAPLSMGLLLAVSRGYLSLSGRVKQATDETKGVGLRALGITNKQPIPADELPTSPHAGVVLAKMNDNQAQPGKPARYLMFLRKRGAGDTDGEENWGTIGESNKKYGKSEFSTVDFGACRLERETTKDGKGNDQVVFNIQIEGQFYSLPVLASHRKKLWDVYDSITNLVNGHPDANLVPTKFELAPSSVMEPALDSSFITDRGQVFNKTSSHNGIQATTILQAKSTLASEECCADWAVVESRGNLTLALVADAAGNKQKSHDGSVKLVNLFRENFWKQIGHPESQGVIDALGQALMLTEIETSADSDATNSTMACVAIITNQEGDRYAVGFCIGDARVMLKRPQGNSLDLTPTVFSDSYSDQGANFGGRVTSVQPIFQKLEEGDVLLLGSDGFGDNMEAKSRGKTPLAALQELHEAGKLNDHDGLRQLAETPEDWIKQATSVSYWTNEGQKVQTPEAKAAREWIEGVSDTQKSLLQKLHTLYSQFVLDEMNDDDLASQVHANCAQTALVHAGAFQISVDKEIENVEAGIAMQNEKSGRKITKEEHNEQLDTKLKELGIFRNHLETYKEYAVKLAPMSEEEKKALFEAWDKDPSEAHDWMMYRIGKPDDFSLISLSVLPATP